MKKFALSLAFIALTFSSCTVEDDNDGSTAPATPTGEISGEIVTSRSFEKGNYTIQGTVRVKNGATLSIAAGSLVTADITNGLDILLIENGGKVILNGTAAEPIVFTEKSKIPGSWGGIVIFGDAPIVSGISNGIPITVAVSEDGTNTSYGGTNDNHNAGSLKYVRVEYAGKKLTDNTSEMNGFSFYAVGKGTILENLVAYKGADDGFEFYGGTASAKNLVSYGNFDDSFDWQDGWRGELNSNWYAYQVNTGNYGMEIEAKNVNNSFGPKITGITLIRAAGTVTEGGTSAAEYDAIQFKKEGNGEFTNILISGYTTEGATAVRIQDANTNINQVNGNKIKLFDVKINNGTSSFAPAGSSFTVSFLPQNYTQSTTANGASLTVGAWAIVDGVSLIQ